MKRFCIALLLLFCSSFAFATTVRVSVVKVPVADQSPAALTAGFQAALQMALVKMSGDSKAAQNPAVKTALKNAADDVKTYSYHQVQGTLFLEVHFDPAALKTLLQTANEPLWGADRPVTLIWFAEPNGKNGMQVLGGGEQSADVDAIHNLAEQRGAPILFPSLDLNDQKLLGVDVVKTLDNADAVQKLSARYAVSSVLIGIANTSNLKSASIQWTWISAGKSSPFTSSSATLSDAIKQGLNQWVDTMSTQVQTVSTQAQTIILSVEGVSDLSVYQTVLKALTQMTPVQHVSLAGLDATGLQLKVSVLGSAQTLAAALTADTRFQPVTTDCTAATANCPAGIDLVYNWNDPAHVTAEPAPDAAIAATTPAAPAPATPAAVAPPSPTPVAAATTPTTTATPSAPAAS